jgi:hypothetical protein
MRNARAELTQVAAACGWKMIRSGPYRTLWELSAEANSSEDGGNALLEVVWTTNGRVLEAIYFHSKGVHDQYICHSERNKRDLIAMILHRVPVEIPEPNNANLADDEIRIPIWEERDKTEL